MLETIMQVSDLSVSLLTRGVADIAEDKFTDQPPALPNHPAWVLGHMTMIRHMIAGQCGVKTEVPSTYPKLFGRGSHPTSDRATYPSKAEMVDLLTKTHASMRAALLAAGPDKLKEPHTIEPLKEVFATLGHLVMGGLILHEGLHLGQLTDWRRAHGLPRLMG